MYKSWTFPEADITFTPNETQFYGETWNYWTGSGGQAADNSDSMCGYSTNKCTWQSTSYRDPSGTWAAADVTESFSGPHCGYGNTTNNDTSFAIWTDFSSC